MLSFGRNQPVFSTEFLQNAREVLRTPYREQILLFHMDKKGRTLEICAMRENPHNGVFVSGPNCEKDDADDLILRVGRLPKNAIEIFYDNRTREFYFFAGQAQKIVFVNEQGGEETLYERSRNFTRAPALFCVAGEYFILSHNKTEEKGGGVYAPA